MKILAISVVFLFLSCSQSRYHYSGQNKKDNAWMRAFKDHVFFFALKEAYKNDTAIFKRIEKKDAFNPYDGLTTEQYRAARALGEDLIKRMPPPALCENCGDSMNYYMATSLHYYNSKELHEIAVKYYKQHSRAEKKVRY